MMHTVNPFSDPEFKKQILGKERRKTDDNSLEDYEILQPTEDISENLKNVISSAPKIPGQAKNIILDASAIASNQKDQKAMEITLALNDVFSKYNKEYGTDLQIDFSNFSNTLINVADPKKRHVLELYVSEVFKSVRPILLLHLINRLALALDYVLDPKRMFSGELSLPDLFLVIEKLQLYIDNLNQMMSEVSIPGSDQILKKLAEENKDSDLESEESKKAVDEFMTLFKKEHGL